MADAPVDSSSPPPPSPSPIERGVFDLLQEAYKIYRANARVLIITCAVALVPASVVKSCAYAAVTAPSVTAAATADAVGNLRTDDLDAAQRALQEARAKHADAQTIERLAADQARLAGEVAQRSMLAARAAMGTFTTFILGIVGTLITTFFVYGLVVPLTNGALTLVVADRRTGGSAGWADAWRMLGRRGVPLLATVIPAACLIAFGFVVFVLPGFVLGLLFAFLAPAVLLEGKVGRAAMRRSVDLVGPDWLRVALMVVVLGVLNWVAQIVVGIFVPRNALFVGGLLSDLLTMVFLPLPILAMVLLYLDVRRKRDGFTDDAAFTEKLRAELAALRAA